MANYSGRVIGDLMAGISGQVQHFLFKIQTCQVSESQRDDGKSSIEEEEATDDIV